MNEKKLGLFSVVSTGVGLIVATTCLMSLCQGSAAIGGMFIVSIVLACALNMITAASLAELNALMPNLTGGLAQYTLAGLGPFVTLVSMVGGYIVCNALMAPSEGAMFGLAIVELTGTAIPSSVISVALTVILIIINLMGVDMFAKIQDIVAFLLIGSLLLLGIIGMIGAGTGVQVSQPLNLTGDIMDGINMAAAAFWLFIGVEFIIPIAKYVDNPKRNIPVGMFLSLGIICIIQIVMLLGLHNYTNWSELAASDTPHILYGISLLGNAGKVWVGLVTVLAAISTQNSVINSITKICYGMAKMNMLPSIFQKTNKNGSPYIGILLYGAVIVAIEATGLASASSLGFMILVASVFWMVSYIISHINLLVLRRRMPKAPRTFRIPLGPVIPVIGIVGMLYMIVNISTDPAERALILTIDAIIFVILAIYAAFWTKYKLKMPLFKPLSIEKVMAMENPLYFEVRKRDSVRMKGNKGNSVPIT